MLRILGSLCILLMVAACGGDKGESKQPAGAGTASEDTGCGCGCGEEEAAGGGGEWTADAGTATVSGRAVFEGDPPRRRPLDLGAEKYCTDMHADEPMLSETYMVAEGGGLANVFVTVVKGLERWRFPAAEGEKVLDQKGCRYDPHVLGMQMGQTLKIRNSDPIMHNVHGFTVADDREAFNYAQAKKGQENDVRMRKPGILFVKCDVHGWMGSYVCVSRTPYFTVTGEDGSFTLPKLPAGTYTLEAWHEKAGTKTQTVTIADGATSEVTFTFSR